MSCGEARCVPLGLWGFNQVVDCMIIAIMSLFMTYRLIRVQYGLDNFIGFVIYLLILTIIHVIVH